MSNAKKYYAYLYDHQVKQLSELGGFLKGLAAAGKTVPGAWAFSNFLENLKEDKE